MKKLESGFYGFFTSKKVDKIQLIIVCIIVLYFLVQISISIFQKLPQ